MDTNSYSNVPIFSTDYLQTRASEQPNSQQTMLFSLTSSLATKRYYNINAINNFIKTGNANSTSLNENCLYATSQSSKALPSIGSAFSALGSLNKQNNQNEPATIKVNYCKPPESLNNHSEIGLNTSFTNKVLNNNETES